MEKQEPTLGCSDIDLNRVNVPDLFDDELWDFWTLAGDELSSRGLMPIKSSQGRGRVRSRARSSANTAQYQAVEWDT